MSPAVTRSGVRGRPRVGAPGPPKRKARAEEPEREDITSSSEDDDGMPPNASRAALRLRLDGPNKNAARSGSTTAARKKASKQTKTTTAPAQKKRARKKQKTHRDADGPQPNDGADYPTPDSNQPTQPVAAPDPTLQPSNGKPNIGDEETGTDHVQPDMLAMLNDACGPRSSPNRQLHEEDETALGSEHFEQHLPNGGIGLGDRMQLDDGGNEAELPDTEPTNEPTNGTMDLTPVNTASRSKKTIASRSSNQKSANSRQNAKASVKGQTGSHQRHTMPATVGTGPSAPMGDLPAFPEQAPPAQSSASTPWLAIFKDAHHERVTRRQNLATKGLGLSQAVANSPKGRAANAPVKPKTPKTPKTPKMPAQEDEADEEEGEEEGDGDYEPLSDASGESLPSLSRAVTRRLAKKNLRKSQGQLSDDHAGLEPENGREAYEQQEEILAEEGLHLVSVNDDEIPGYHKKGLELDPEFDSDDDEESQEHEDETLAEAPDDGTDAYEEWAQQLIAIQLHEDKFEIDGGDVGSLFMHDVRQFRARAPPNRDDSAFLDTPATSNSIVTIPLPKQDVVKAHSLMRLKGWSQLSSNWHIRILATNEATTGPGKYMSHHLTKLGRFCSVAPSAPEIREQSQFFHDHRDLISHYFDQINIGMDKIQKGGLSPADAPPDDNTEVWQKKREDMFQDLVRLIIPLLVQLLRQAYSLGEEERDCSSFSVYTIQLLGRIVAWTRQLYEPLMRHIGTDPLEEEPQAKTAKAQWQRDNRAREQLGGLLKNLRLLLSEAPTMLQEEERHQAVLKSARKIQLQRQTDIQLRQQLTAASRDEAQKEQNRRVALAIRGETPIISSRSRATSMLRDESRYGGSSPSRAQTIELEADQVSDAGADDWTREEEVALCKKVQKAYDYDPPRLPDLATTAATVGHSKGETKEKARDLLSSMLTQAFPQRSGRDIQREVFGLMRQWR